MKQNNKNSKDKESKNLSINNTNLFDGFPRQSKDNNFHNSSYFNNKSKKSNSNNNKLKRKDQNPFQKNACNYL